jgi:hypothetical protein
MGLVLVAQLEEVEAEVQRAQSAVVKRGTRALAVAWVPAAAALLDAPPAVALLDALLDAELTWVQEKVEPDSHSLFLPFRQLVSFRSKPRSLILLLRLGRQ